MEEAKEYKRNIEELEQNEEILNDIVFKRGENTWKGVYFEINIQIQIIQLETNNEISGETNKWSGCQDC